MSDAETGSKCQSPLHPLEAVTSPSLCLCLLAAFKDHPEETQVSPAPGSWEGRVRKG